MRTEGKTGKTNNCLNDSEIYETNIMTIKITLYTKSHWVSKFNKLHWNGYETDFTTDQIAMSYTSFVQVKDEKKQQFNHIKL